MKKTEENVEKEESIQEKEEPSSLGKFQSVDALLSAYLNLESEFTKRCQKLKALEGELASMHSQKEAVPSQGAAQENGELSSEELYSAVQRDEKVKSRVLSDYLQSLKGVPLLAGTGAGVSAPASRPKTIAEAGKLALGYFRSKK